MKKLAAYLRGLVADANLAIDARQRCERIQSPAIDRTLDHPTYLRRGLAIDGLCSGRRPR